MERRGEIFAFFFMRKIINTFLVGALASACGCSLMYFSSAMGGSAISYPVPQTHTDSNDDTTLNCSYVASDIQTVDTETCPIPMYAVGIALNRDGSKLPFKLKCAPCRLPNAIIDENDSNFVRDNPHF